MKELILGIDSKSFNLKYKEILNKFLYQTKFKKKIKLSFLTLIQIQQIIAMLRQGGLQMSIIN